MFKKVLVANRGEIAVRIIRSCKDLGIATVAVFSEADRDSRAVKLADEAVCIGPPASAKSYLNIPNIISAATITGADAIHPGYGFLAENSYLAEVCKDVKITFIGPSAEVMDRMADKVRARDEMDKAGLPIIPGSEQATHGLADAEHTAREIGYPVMVKASAGGGGRGLRVVRGPEELARVYPTAQAEAESAFGNGELYIERYLERARHIEIQILVDNHGHAFHLGERDCSIQRRHQKLVEESPSPAVSDELRAKMGSLAAKAAAQVGYTNAGTMEFLVDAKGRFYFMEINTRIQVEHPVTEAIYDVDLVKLQLAVAAGEKLPLKQADLKPSGHAIECRVNAEDPARDFAPDAGLVSEFVPPGGPGIRVDTHLFQGYRVPPFYDSLLAKVIAHGHDRAESVARMRRALEEFSIGGIKTSIPFHLKVLSDPVFLNGQADTTYVDKASA
ncbi:MAG TPA: acetyl-CoA carboxylase biotin carboxylase subunit [Chloroflexota bacterium]|nr:acetyl-CoA carboxylase biotin carboxylase subunit [Chloroflexota bacterium]